jgi:hypothetical protein
MEINPLIRMLLMEYLTDFHQRRKEGDQRKKRRI